MTREAEDYCGCCGNPCGRGRVFCNRCQTKVGHLGPSSLHAWDRTFEATHGVPCPFQVSAG
jgi:hypothetical protein